MRHALAVLVLFIGILLVCAGCRKNPYDQKISAADQEELNRWLSFNTHRLSVREIEEINNSMREIRISFMLRDAKKSKTNETLNRLLCEKINGLPLKEMVVMGYELQIGRYEVERLRLVGDLHHKNKLKTRPGDLDSECFLREQKEMVGEQIGEFDSRIERCKTRIKELCEKFAMPDPATDSTPPERISTGDS
ncbi:thermostable 8-oxoguanine DNA glycosylase [Ereboglobus sp. PH5-5]|nr:thermostable 8-oxoguanine DNA glycosylase [Ereboglobus sp. PH5-5]